MHVTIVDVKVSVYCFRWAKQLTYKTLELTKHLSYSKTPNYISNASVLKDSSITLRRLFKFPLALS